MYRLMKPRGFFRPDISESNAWSVPIPPPPPMPPMKIGSLAAPISERTSVVAGGRREVGQPVAPGIERGAHGRAEAPAASLRAERSAVAQGVRLVEEHDHPAVANGELAELAVQALHLEDPDAHEHLDERARIDEHERLRGLPGDGLRHQRLPRAGRAPEQQTAGHVATTVLDRFGIVEEDHVLLDPLQDRVLPLHVGEARLQVVRHVRVDAAARQEPEQPSELDDDEEESERQLEDEGEGRDEAAGRVEEPEPHRVGLEQAPEERAEREQEDERLERPRRAEPRPVIHLPQPTRGAGEHGLLPEAVVALRMLLDQEMGLPDHLDAQEHQEPGVVVERDPHRVGERATDRVHGGGPHDREPACPQAQQQDHELDPIPERGGDATLPLGQARARHVRRTGGDRRAIALLAHGNTVQESTIDEISELLRW